MCDARQYSDQMICGTCGLQWDVNDLEPPECKPDKKVSIYKIGDKVKKRSDSEWSGKVCGYYSTELTPIGVAVESDTHKGSVQIYPEKALMR
jgi:dihydrofolate reductase (trimethoprim resistance protein)